MKQDSHISHRAGVPEILWNAWCIASVMGIWPRYIEPNLLAVTRLNLMIPRLPSSLRGLKVLHFTDLHVHPGMSNHLINKLLRKIKSLAPDIIVFTGDFLCFSECRDKNRLNHILHSCVAPYGCYAVLGNHDYAQSVSVNEQGHYDLVSRQSSSIIQGMKRLFSTTTMTGQVTERAREVGFHAELIDLLDATPFQLLENDTQQIPIKGSFLNLCGLGEYALGRCRPEKAFENYDTRYPGIVLLHNPDGFPHLAKFPGEIVLCGHTHGGQTNLPWIWKKLTLLENKEFKKGLKKIDGKWLYINRGVGSTMPFRWFSLPELALITLQG